MEVFDNYISIRPVNGVCDAADWDAERPDAIGDHDLGDPGGRRLGRSHALRHHGPRGASVTWKSEEK